MINFENQYNTYILPFYEKFKYETDVDLFEYHKERITDLFKNKKLEFVKYSSFVDFDLYSYNKKKFPNEPYANFLGSTDFDLFLSLKNKKCHRRVRQLMELCCDLTHNTVNTYPVFTPPDSMHPGKTLTQAHAILNKGLHMVRISDLEYADSGEVVTRFNSLDDIQKVYKNPIMCYMKAPEIDGKLQIISFSKNFSSLDGKGYLSWKSDKVSWTASRFFEELEKRTSHIDGKELSFVYDETEFKYKKPNTYQEQYAILMELFKWGYENCEYV